MNEERERRRSGWLTNEWAHRCGRLDRPALSPKACRCRKPRRVVFRWTNGRTDGLSGREGVNETKRWKNKNKNDNSRKQICFSALSKPQSSNPRPGISRRRSVGWTNKQTEDQDGRELTKRHAGKTKTIIPETNLFLYLL